MKLQTKVILAVLITAAVTGIIYFSFVERLQAKEAITITNQGINMTNHPEATKVTQEKDGHLTLSP